MDVFSLAKPLIHSLDPEKAHDLAIRALEWKLVPAQKVENTGLGVECFGLKFPNPVGLAAGFDKNARAFPALLKQGFGFVEIGTVTPRPQRGNPKPRLFRLNEDEAIINRFGFNSEGMEAVKRRLERRDKSAGIIGVNIGKNKDTVDALSDYLKVLMYLQAHADYITVNISSPNTPGLRSLQDKEALRRLLTPLMEHKTVPLLVKISPDLEPKEREEVAEVLLALRVNGIIVSNTTVSRPGLTDRKRLEAGGLSGRPVLAMANESLAAFHQHLGGKVPIIGVGGIASPGDALGKFNAGATLVQLYSALIFQGFGLVPRILGALPRRD